MQLHHKESLITRSTNIMQHLHSWRKTEMESSVPPKPHLVCFPYPAQGHINPMFKLATLLHSRGCHITFLHTEFNYQRLLKSSGLVHLEGHEGFQYETIPDGLPPESNRGAKDIPTLCASMPRDSVGPFRELILRLNSSPDVPPVSCILSDGANGFTLRVADELGVPEVMLFTPSAAGVLSFLHYNELVARGYFPLKDESCLTNGYLDTQINCIPAMEGIQLKDLPSFIKTTDPNDIMFNQNINEVAIASRSRAVIINTFDDLEQDVLGVIRSKFPPVYTIGPLSLLCSQIQEQEQNNSNLWEEDKSCLEWLENRDPKSVLYVNFGSLATMTSQQLSEFAWGLANTKYPFLWIVRSDLVHGESEIKSEEFTKEIEGRGLLIGWCPQEKVLKHPSIGGFLTHCGWNSTLESISEGVPMLCWPFFAEQPTNCYFVEKKWGIGMEINNDVKREEIEKIVKELMEGEKGEQIKNNSRELKKKAIEATNPGGSSYTNFERLLENVFHVSKREVN